MTLAERVQAVQPLDYGSMMARLEAKRAWAATFAPDEGIDREWGGWIAAWVEEWRVLTGEEIGESIVAIDLPLRHLMSNSAVMDASPGCAPPVALAMARPDATLVCVIEDVERADGLEAALARLQVDNVIVSREPVRGVKFQDVVCRDQRPVEEILRRTDKLVAMGGRRFLARDHDEGLPLGGLLFQKIPLGAKCLALHFNGVAEEPGVAELLATGKLLLGKIEGEMRRLGMWAEGPPAMPPMKSYLDAPSFALWLQCVFLVRAHEAVEDDELPEDSQVSRMAHQQGIDAPRLMEYLRAFDLLVVQRHQPGLQMTGMQAISEGGRLLTKGKWREPAWFSVDATPYDTAYFPKAMASLAWGLGMEVQGEDPWEFVLDGVRVAARMNYRGSCSIAAETAEVRDKIFHGLTRTRI